MTTTDLDVGYDATNHSGSVLETGVLVDQVQV
jgi:hypothetical protein